MGSSTLSNVNSSSAVVKAAKGVLAGAILAAGNANATLIIYDNASAASGTKLLELHVLANDTVAVDAHHVVATAGLYAAVTGTGAIYTVFYQ